MLPAKSFLSWAILPTMAVLLLPHSVSADTVYSTFGPGESFNYGSAVGINDGSSWAVPFVPTRTYTFTQIDIALAGAFPLTIGVDTVHIYLNADSGGLPGAFLDGWELTDLPYAPTPTPYAPTSLVATTNITLFAGTQYWLAAEPQAPETAVDWNLTYTTSTTAFPGAHMSDEPERPWTLTSFPAGQGPPGFDVLGTPIGLVCCLGPLGLGFLQGLNVTAGPITPPPGTPVEMTLGLVDLKGNPVVPSLTTTLSAGQTATLNFNADTLIKQPGERLEVIPVVTAGPNGPPAAFQASVEVFDEITQFGTLLLRGQTAPSGAPVFDRQSLAGEQTIRVNLSAFPPTPCIASVSFNDASTGQALAPAMPVNLSPGQSTSVDLNAKTLFLRFGQRIEVVPQVVLMPPITTGPPLTVACQATVEVFDNRTGRTSTYQVGGSEQ
jgi:hypothetical protein